INLPTDRPRPSVQTFRGETQTKALSSALTRKLEELSRREGATLFMTLLAGWYVLLHRYSGEDDIVVGTPIANRTRTEVEGLIGFFVNTLALRASAAGNPTFVDLLRRVREMANQAYAHQELPFERLVAEIAPERHLSHTPLFQVFFALQGGPEAGAGERVRLDLPTGRIQTLETTSMFDLSLTMFHSGDQLSASFE